MNVDENDRFLSSSEPDTNSVLDFKVIISKIRQALLSAEAIYLFGLVAEGMEKPESDVDIAVLVPPIESKALSHREFFDVHIALSDEFHREDLVDFYARARVPAARSCPDGGVLSITIWMILLNLQS